MTVQSTSQGIPSDRKDSSESTQNKSPARAWTAGERSENPQIKYFGASFGPGEYSRGQPRKT